MRICIVPMVVSLSDVAVKGGKAKQQNNQKITKKKPRETENVKVKYR